MIKSSSSTSMIVNDVDMEQSATPPIGSNLHSFGVSTESVKSKDRFQFWSDLNQPAFSMKPLRGDVSDFTASVDCWRAGEITLAEMCFIPGINNPYTIDIGHCNLDVLAVRFYKSSDQQGLLGDDSVNFQTGEIHIYPFGQQLRTVTSHLEQTTAYIPYDVVGYDPSTCPQHICLRPDSAVTHVIRSALTTLTKCLRNGGKDAGSAGDAFAGLIRGVIQDVDTNGDQRRLFELSRSVALRSFIQQNIHDAEMDAKQVYNSFGASRATVYREFSEYGGIASYISNLRLRRAMLDLASSDGQRGTIKDVALRYGFKEASTFSRAFRKHFDVSPRDYLGLCNEDAEHAVGLSSPIGDMPSVRIDDWVLPK